MQEADKHLDFLRTPTIFDLDLIDNGLIFGTRIETLYDMGLMVNELLIFEDLVRCENYTVTEDDLIYLYRKYPLLESLCTDQADEPLNYYVELERRLDRWRDARMYLCSPASTKEKEATRALLVFIDHYATQRHFQFLKRPTRVKLTVHLLADQHALDELWALTQRLKQRPLTPSQEEGRQKLANYVALEIRGFLIFIEWTDRLERVCRSGQEVRANELNEEKKKAMKIVDERIARGEWQGMGEYKFKFRPSYRAARE